jgi:hypothetical protein
MIRSLVLAFAVAASAAALATCISAAQAQTVRYCYTDPQTRQVQCFATLGACSQAAVYVPGAVCRAR